MSDVLMLAASEAMVGVIFDVVRAVWPYLIIALGFSVVIFVHELGHFAVAKWAGVRVDKFAIGFGRELFGFTRGETRYSFNLLPLGGYVKMLGQEDFDDKTNEWKVKDDPRAYINKSVEARMAIVSAGVIMNVIFAAVAFMLVMMLGMSVEVPVIGQVAVNSPAALAGLEVGDRVIEVDGQEINEFRDVNMAVMLSPPHEPVDFVVRRGDQTKRFSVTPRNDPNTGDRLVGISGALTREVVAVLPEWGRTAADGGLQPGDLIVAINDRPVSEADGNRLYELLQAATPGSVRVTVERRSSGGRPADARTPPSDAAGVDADTRRVTVTLKPQLRIDPPDPAVRDQIHLLGLVPLSEISNVEPQSRAYYAGLKPGDVILKWGDVRYPTEKDILDIVRNSLERDVPVEVERTVDGQTDRRKLFVRPKKKFKLYGKPEVPRIGIVYGAAATHTTQIASVAATLDGEPTAAAKAGLQAGDRIVGVGGQPVSDWSDLVETFRASAGSPVPIAYRTAQGEERTTHMEIPHCVHTLLGLPVGGRVIAVDGQDSHAIEFEGRSQRATMANTFVLREFLKTRIGKTVPVTYVARYGEAPQTAEVPITAGMVDPWLGRLVYDFPIVPGIERTTLRISNPITALWVGSKKAYYFVMQVYTVIHRMIFARSVGVEKISGPVGIFRMGGEVARRGLVDMLFFLGIISANLAVLNFLPLPIVDGGLMVFLIIEKIKRSPVSLKVQIATQVIGLVLILMAVVLVTIQDITR